MSRPLRAAALALAIGAVSVLPAAAAEAEMCPGLDSGRVEAADNPFTVTVDAPAGQAIMLYCVATVAGNDPELIAVDPGVASLLLSHPSGLAIAHWSVAYGTVPAPVDDGPADVWWPTAPTAPATPEPPAAPAPALDPASQPVPVSPPAAPEPPSGAPVPMVASSPTDAPTLGQNSGPRAPSTARSSMARSSTAPSHVPDVSVVVRTASPVAPPSTEAQPTDGSVVADPSGTLPTDLSQPDVPGGASAAASSSPATLAMAGDVRRAGFSGGGEPGALVTMVLVLAMLGSAAAVLHVARRESPKG